ncbi:MAG TPA: response regulator [Candidatus Dormibacteraeota bacterium]|nr:response regulator [Candidatus Dormibacteraeota bacterium]
MSGLENFLAPFSHLLFANRNIVIVLLCVGLFLVAFDALFHRWKTERLHRDLSTAKSSGGYTPAGRRYAAAAPVVEEPAHGEAGGALPPIKGGRTYARNLGSALQKAGMSSPQIYSPPTPPGYSNPAQAAQPAMPPYTPPATPWGAPQAPAPTPWAFQGGPGRPPQGPPAGPVPLYQLQPGTPPQPPLGMPQPPAPSMPGPGLYSAPPASGPYTPPAPPFGQPTFPIPATGSSAPAPSFSPPGATNPPMMPPFPAPPAQQPAATDASRRGKPKRRRFNFNVLENLEKMVQPKAAEPIPTSSWTPPAAAPGSPAGPAAPVAPSATTFQPINQPPVASVPPAVPAAERATSPEAPSLPLQFEVAPTAQSKPQLEPATEQSATDLTLEAPEEQIAEPAVAAPEAVASAGETHASEPEAAAAPEPEPAPEPRPDARRSMRSMMFGEEVAAPEAQAETEAPAAAPEPAEAAQTETSAPTAAPAPAEEPSWSSYPWSQREEASSSTGESEPTETETSAPAVEETPEAEPAGSTTSDSFDPWSPSYASEREGTSEPDSNETAAPAAEAAEAPASASPDEPAGRADGQSSAGTIVIIEDDATAASYYSTLFSGNGYHVEVANDGVSGVDLATRMQPQVILLDVMMPRQNGILVLQTLRASDETKNTPVVVMSNFSEPTLIKRALQLGALEYVIKTQVEGPALLNALPRWMNREKAFAAA